MEKDEQRQVRTIFGGVRKFLNRRFNLDEDGADHNEVIDNIKRGVDFRGTNLWVLMFAIVVASVGLNVNSTAVIIGAMLISPLMGPIMGIGLSLGINDFELLKRSSRNFLFAVLVSLVVSTLYFMVSPLSTAQSELLARTTPTIWDVLIATFGGLAGIVAQTRRDRTSTVIPGVAIATALMPPLCTAGFGLATGNWSYFGGAFYLFFINAVFIAFATFFIVRFLKYERKKQLNPARAKQVNRMMIVIITVTLVPSVILAYGIVQRTIFETSAAKYINEVFVFKSSEVISSSINYDPNGKGNSIEVVMVGESLSSDAIEAVRSQLGFFSLDGTQVVVRQANNDDGVSNLDLAKVLRSNTQIIDEKNSQIKLLEAQLKGYSTDTIPSMAIARELGSLWGDVLSVALNRSAVFSTDGKTIGHQLLCVVTTKTKSDMKESDYERLRNWLSERTKIRDVKIIIEKQDKR